jgi:cell fate regulator YaaT (PSP1 superfamily)
MTEHIEPKKQVEEPQVCGFGKSKPAAPAVGVSFRSGGKLYSFDTRGIHLQLGDHVLVDSEKGLDIAEVIRLIPDLSTMEHDGPLKPIVRKATEEDMAHEQKLRQQERIALRTCERKVAQHGLPMKLIDADYTFEGRCLVFFFSAEGRVDFRDLVRDLAKTFKTRIELRQIGVRDEAKMLGGLGACGRPLCCQTFLRNFDPVSIKVAKDQGLSLNPAKISGVCDRLMCCLRYEQKMYQEIRAQMPAVGETVSTVEGQGLVLEQQVLAEQVVVQLEDESRVTISVDKLKPRSGGRRRRR